jgi:hypothetical protein
MAFTSTTPAVVGNATKADDLNNVHVNTKENKDMIAGDNGEGTGVATQNHTGSGRGVQIPTAGIEDNAITEAKIADTDLPVAAKVIATAGTVAAPSWSDSTTGAYDNDSNFLSSAYTVPSDGLYALFAMFTIDDNGVAADLAEVKFEIGSTSIAKTTTTTVSGGNDYKMAQLYVEEVLSASDVITLDTATLVGSPTLVTGRDRSYWGIRKLPWTTSY